MTLAKKPGTVQARELLSLLFASAIASAQPSRCVAAHLPDPQSMGRGRLIVIGAGKASAAMARAVEDHWTGSADQLAGFMDPCFTSKSDHGSSTNDSFQYPSGPDTTLS